jgi:hypothetical protein
MKEHASADVKTTVRAMLDIHCGDMMEVEVELAARTAELEEARKDAANKSQAVRDVVAERERQQSAEGWTSEHDDEHDGGELASASASYAIDAAEQLRSRGRPITRVPLCWPWDMGWWKPKGPRIDLVRAAALLIAEIERLDRAAMSGKAGT